MADKLVCPICGEPTNVYMGNARKDRLCRKHSFDLKEGKLAFCDKCGMWHYVDQPCKCAPVSESKQSPKSNRCIVCGDDAPNGALCRKCYYEIHH